MANVHAERVSIGIASERESPLWKEEPSSTDRSHLGGMGQQQQLHRLHLTTERHLHSSDAQVGSHDLAYAGYRSSDF